MKCFQCGLEIDAKLGEKYMMVPIEIPYTNLFFHKETCYRDMKVREKEYLMENSERIYEYANKPSKKR
jgi:hypothetical protein